MAQVTGVGGIFIRSPDPAALAAWYSRYLGVPAERFGSATFHWVCNSPTDCGSTTWAPFPAETPYFGPGDQQAMINFRVDDLKALLSQLRTSGVQVVEDVEEGEFGRFGWCVDLDGNRVELWEPAPGM